jgi:hypothetical protein
MAIVKEKYGTVTKNSATSLSLADSTIKVGGRFQKTGTLTMLTSTGLDTGVIALSTFYYLYVVSVGGIISLKASLSASAPTGFTSYKKVGAFYTDASSNIFKVYSFGAFNRITLGASVAGSGAVSGDDADFISGDAVLSATSVLTFTFTPNYFSVAPHIAHINVSTNGLVNLNSGLPTTTGFQTRGSNTSNAASAIGFSFICVKSGVDAIQPDWCDY